MYEWEKCHPKTLLFCLPQALQNVRGEHSLLAEREGQPFTGEEGGDVGQKRALGGSRGSWGRVVGSQPG